MIDGQRVLAVITARGGSKGIVRKNVRLVGGKPMIAWSVEAALGSRFLDRVVLSTDDDEIAAVARQFGCDVPFRRPADLATDDATSIDVVVHAVQSLPESYEWVVLLQPTSPLRRTSDIDNALDLCVRSHAEFCVSVSEFTKPMSWMFTLQPDRRITPCIASEMATQRQDADVSYYLNGAVYVGRTKTLTTNRSFICPETLAYVMPRNRSADIDDEIDLLIADALLRQNDADISPQYPR